MIWEAEIMNEAKKDFDKKLIAQYNRITRYAEKLSEEKDEAKRARGQSIIDTQFEELSTFKEWADTAQLFINTLIQNHEEEKNRSYAKGYRAGEAAQGGTYGFRTVGDYRAFKQSQGEAQRIKWQDHH